MSNFREKVWVKFISCFIVGIFLFSEFTWTKNLDFTSLVLSNTVFYRKIISQKVEKTSFLKRILEEHQKKENLLNRLKLFLLPEASAKEIEEFYFPYSKIEISNPYVFNSSFVLKPSLSYSRDDTVKRLNDTVIEVPINDTVEGEGKNFTSSEQPTGGLVSLITSFFNSLVDKINNFYNFLNDCWKALVESIGIDISESEVEEDGTVSLSTLTQKMEEKGYKLFKPEKKKDIKIEEGDILIINEGKKNKKGESIYHVIEVTEVDGGKIKYKEEVGGKIVQKEISVEELKPKIEYMYSQEAREGWSEVSVVSSDIFIGGVPSDRVPYGSAYRPEEEEFEEGDDDSLSSFQGSEIDRGSNDAISDTVSEVRDSTLKVDTSSTKDVSVVTLNNGDTLSLSSFQENTLQEGKPLFVAKSEGGEYKIAHTIGELESETNNLGEVFILFPNKESIQLSQSYTDMVNNGEKIIVIQGKDGISTGQIEGGEFITIQGKERDIRRDDKVIVIGKDANLILSGETFQEITGEKNSAILEITLDRERRTISAKTTSDLRRGEDKIFVFVNNQEGTLSNNLEKRNIIEGLFRVGSEGLRESLLKTGPPSKKAEVQRSNSEVSTLGSFQEKVILFVFQPSLEKENKVEISIRGEGKALFLSFSEGENTLHINILNSESGTVDDTVIEAVDLALALIDNFNKNADKNKIISSVDSQEIIITLIKP